jgi:hypothetical protein
LSPKDSISFSLGSGGSSGFGFWIETGWVDEFTIVVLGGEVGLNGVGNSEEVLHVDLVADVGVNVILEVLEHVHVFHDEVISSESWERESLIIKFPGLNSELWEILSSLLNEGFMDVLNVSPVSWVKSSGEHFHLIFEFTNRLVKVDAWIVSLSGLDGVNEVFGINLGGSGGTNKEEKSGEFHIYMHTNKVNRLLLFVIIACGYDCRTKNLYYRDQCYVIFDILLTFNLLN